MREEVEDEYVIKSSLTHCQLWPSKPIKSLFCSVFHFVIHYVFHSISLTLFSLRRQYGILETAWTLVTD